MARDQREVVAKEQNRLVVVVNNKYQSSSLQSTRCKQQQKIREREYPPRVLPRQRRIKLQDKINGLERSLKTRLLVAKAVDKQLVRVKPS